MATFFEKAHLQNLLERIARDECFEQPKFTIVSATNPGENFVGQVFRVNVAETSDGQSERCTSLIFKIPSSNSARKEEISSDTLFRTESEMYEIVLPTLNSFLKKHGLSNSSVFPGTPRCFATGLNSNTRESDVIVLEDKKVAGYGMGDIKTGLDVTQCRVALEKLAVLHSSYLALREHEPETADRLARILDKHIWEDDDDPMVVDLRRGYLYGLDFLGEPYTKGNPVYEELEKIHENFNEHFNDFVKMTNNSDVLTCISHGDFWANNVLFKLNQDGTAEDACLIDFQLAAINCPANDLSVFLFLCTTKEVRDAHYDDLIQLYYDEVSKTLRACDCDPDKLIPWNKSVWTRTREYRAKRYSERQGRKRSSKE